MNEEDQVFEMLDGVIAVMAVELGHQPTPPEVMTRLALMTGCYIGGAAEDRDDPDTFISKACQPIEPTARAVYQELTK